MTEAHPEWKVTHEDMIHNLHHLIAAISAATRKPYIVKTVGNQKYRIIVDGTGEQLGGVHTYSVWLKILQVSLHIVRDAGGYTIDQLLTERTRLGLND